MTASAEIPTRTGPVPIVVVGHVDHGKSTLIGRLLSDTGSLPDGREAEIRKSCQRRGIDFQWAFLLDALQAERDQGITIDTTRIRFRSARRDYVIIDAPGHREFLRNMVTGAASAEAAVLVIDAEEGVREQSRRHAYVLRLLGVSQVAVAVNKIDLVDFDAARFAAVRDEIRSYLAGLDITPVAIVPVSARDGDNVAGRSARMAWYDGPDIVTALDSFARPPALLDAPLRLPVQDVYRFDHRRIVAGRIESGRLRVGDRLRFLPGGATARVAALEDWSGQAPKISAGAGESVGIALDDEIFIERGAVAVADDPVAAGAELIAGSHELLARLFWLGREPLEAGTRLRLRIGPATHQVTVARIDRVIDVADLSGSPGGPVPRHGVAEVLLRSRTPVVGDPFGALAATGRGVLVQGHDIVGGVTLTGDAGAAAAGNLYPVDHAVTAEARDRANGHGGGVLWLTGLSGSGKSTLAMALEKALFARGFQVYVLDGDNVRRGLTADLGFDAASRRENIRRVAETARLFADAGVIVIAALISPLRADRDMARRICGDAFREVHVKAPLEVCEQRDPRGLYRRARAGEIAGFTGIDSPWQPPEHPDLVIPTAEWTVEQALARLVETVDGAFVEPAAGRSGVAAA